MGFASHCIQGVTTRLCIKQNEIWRLLGAIIQPFNPEFGCFPPIQGPVGTPQAAAFSPPFAGADHAICGSTNCASALSLEHFKVIQTRQNRLLENVRPHSMPDATWKMCSLLIKLETTGLEDCHIHRKVRAISLSHKLCACINIYIYHSIFTTI